MFLSLQMYGQQNQITNLKLSFSNACAHSGFNNFWVEFEWKGNHASVDNEFVVELSSPLGDFATPTHLATFKGRGRDGNGGKPNFTKIDFQLPDNTAGSAYKVRVRSTNPVVQAESTPVGAYYQSITAKLRVNDQQDVTLCAGASKVISVDNTKASLYKWFKDGVVIPNETGPTLRVSQSGQYVAAADYGTCSDATKSNPIVVSVLSGTAKVEIEGDKHIEVCQDQVHTLQATLKSPTIHYIWYKDGNKVDEGIGKHTYNVPANTQGSYVVQYGDDNDCFTRSEPVILSQYQVQDFEITTQSTETQELYSGAELKLEVETSPKGVETEIKWYKDGVLLSETSKKYSERVTTPATYTIEVANKSKCPSVNVITKTKDFVVKVIEVEKIPNVVLLRSLEVLNSKWVLPELYRNKDTQITIYSQTGEQVYDGVNYDNDFPSTQSQNQNQGRGEVYFYIIKQEGKEPIRGTFTVLN